MSVHGENEYGWDGSGSGEDGEPMVDALRRLGATIDPPRQRQEQPRATLDTLLRPAGGPPGPASQPAWEWRSADTEAEALARGPAQSYPVMYSFLARADEMRRAFEPRGEGGVLPTQRPEAADDAQKAQMEYEALKKRVQVDLNDARNLTDLEDPGLREHMVRARQQLTAHERELAQLPPLEALLQKDTAGRRSLSALMVALKEQEMALQCACDDVALQAGNVGRLVAGEKPHGFPAVGVPLQAGAPLAANLAHLAKRLDSVGGDLTGIVGALERFERELTLARRSYEEVVDGLRRRLDCYAEPAQAPPEGPVQAPAQGGAGGWAADPPRG